MTPESFCALLDTHGADFRRWPEGERASARALADQNPELRRQLAAAALLDDWLDRYVVSAADEALILRIESGAAGIAHPAADRVRAEAAAVADDAAGGLVAEAASGAGTRLPPAIAGRPAARDPWWKARWLWPGAGLAGIGLAGTLAGALLVSAVLRVAPPPVAMDWPERATAFNELPADWSEE